MTAWDPLGPFQPGSGGMPPHLAGREAEQSLFRALLTRLAERGPLPAEVILYGPRGNGKTVLLGWLENQAATVDGVETLVLLPSEISGAERLSELVLPRSWWDRFTSEQVAGFGISWRPGSKGGAPPAVDRILAARARRGPLLLIMDEAHTLDVRVGRMLLNASQRVRQEHAFVLVLAGTPDIQGHLARMSASFWSRAEHLRIGRLDRSATREALLRPFAAEDVPVEESVVAEVERLSHGYPFFIQILGQVLWKHAAPPGGPGRVTEGVLEAALPAFEQRKGHYYRERYFELEDRGLLAVGRSVAEAFRGAPVLSGQSLARAIAGGLSSPGDAEIAGARQVLADLGFIWGTSPTPGWEPGIPSLMDYIFEFAPAG